MTAKQREVLDYLREHGWSTERDLRRDLGTNKSGMSLRLNALLRAGLVTLRAGSGYSYEWNIKEPAR